MCEVFRAHLTFVAIACMVLVEGFRTQPRNAIGGGLLNQVADICCCKIGINVKEMATYEAIKGDVFKSMHFYAEKSKSSAQLGSIAKGNKVWALNSNPEEEGWLELAYMKNGNVGTGWSRFAEDRFKRLETEQVKHTECTISDKQCDPEDVTVPGATDPTVCETFLNDVPVPSSTEIEWRKEAPTLLGEARDLFMERSLHLTTALPQQAEYRLEKLEGLLQDLEASDYCVTWPPWCAFKHFKLSYNWRQLKSVVKEMVGIFAGHEEASQDLHANLAAMRDQAIATKIAAMEKALIIAEMKSLDGSTVMRGFAWTTAAASSSQYKAFCSGKSFFDAEDSWKNPDWWEKMYEGCPEEGLTPKDLLDIQADVNSATNIPLARADLQTNSVIRTVVASGRGVALVQVKDEETLSASSFVNRTHGEQGTRDGFDAILMFLFLSACGCSTLVAGGGALLVL